MINAILGEVALMYIMTVEDDTAIREAISEVLTYAGYQVINAIHGQDALDLLDENAAKPGLILLDLMMPVMDGWVFLETISKRPELATIPVVIVSAVNFETKISQYPNVKEIIRKPIVIDRLLKTVAHVCGAGGAS